MNVKHNRLLFDAGEHSEMIALAMFMIYFIVITTMRMRREINLFSFFFFCAFALGNPHGNNSIKI